MSKFLDDHRIAASRMTWCGLSGVIMDMENELLELKPYLKKKEIKSHTAVMLVYEKEKARRVVDQSQGTDYARLLFDDEEISTEYY